MTGLLEHLMGRAEIEIQDPTKGSEERNDPLDAIGYV
jgi:hypothetical protein